jgi:DNA-binding transcriptional LysR family regulator
MTFASLDLNLLRVFDAVLRHGSVTQAGRVLGLSQPAMSNALGRLRHHYGDPLFIRTPAGMEPTARALRIAGPIRAAMEQIEISLRQVELAEPAAIRRRFRIALVEYAALYLQPALVKAVSQAAPKAELAFFHAGQEDIRRLIQGEECDLALGVIPDKPLGWSGEILFHDRSVMVCSRDHPRAAGQDARAMFNAERHVRVPMNRLIDQALAGQGIAATEAASAPDLIAACFIVSRTDLVATIPEGVARICQDLLGLRIMNLPVDLPPYPIELVFHPRHRGDPEHDWLREILGEVAARLRATLNIANTGGQAWEPRFDWPLDG